MLCPLVRDRRLRFESLENRLLLAGMPGELDLPATLEGTGTHFELTDSEYPKLPQGPAMAAPTVSMVKDINAQPPITKPSELADIGGTLMFAANELIHGTELWRVDPVSGKRTLVRNIRPGSASSDPTDLTAVGEVAYFVANDGTHGLELWKSDGTTEGTVLVKDINPGTASSRPVGLVNFGGTLYFEADDGAHGRELWKSDGTAAGTVLVKDINTGPDDGLGWWLDYFTSGLTVFQGALYFAADDGVHGWELWKSDGTAAGTALLKDINTGSADGLFSGSLNFPELEVAGSNLYLIANDGTHGFELWKSDGTAAGTVLVKDIEPGTGGSMLSWPYPSDMTAVGSGLFFVIEDTAHGWALLHTDGTAAGTIIVKDTWNPAYELTDVGGTLFFVDWGSFSCTLWKSDGTVAGTSQVSTSVELPYDLASVGGYLYFRGRSGHGWELWRSDGTATGTFEVKDINPGSADSMPNFPGDEAPYLFTDLNGTLYFKATDGVHGFTLWKSDGTAAGTAAVPISGDLTLDAQPRWLTRVGPDLYFVADDGLNGTELWKSDGTAGGTAMVKDITPGSTGAGPARLVAFGSNLLMVADDGTHGYELWISDGTSAGTSMLKDIRPGTGGFGPSEMKVLGSQVLFVADDGVHGAELWKTDGTAAGTSMVADLNPGSTGSSPYEPTSLEGVVYFKANDGVHGVELWKTDGTAAGTSMVKDINPGSANGFPYHPSWLTAVGTLLYFVADDGVHGAELWKTDGTAAGTSMVADLNPGSTGSSPQQLTSVEEVVYFTADDGVHGIELWKTDGTAAGTSLVDDFTPGVTGTGISSLTALGQILYFSASESAYGRELYRMPIATEQMALVADILPGDKGSFPGCLKVVGDSFYLTADDGIHGEELWRVANQAPILTVDEVLIAADEGDIAVNGGTVIDPDGDPVSLSASSGTVTDNGDGTWTWQLLTTDGPTEGGSITVSAIDAAGATRNATFQLQVANVAPTILEPWLETPDGAVLIGTPVRLQAEFEDRGTGDTHTALWDWGDATTPGTVTETGGSGTVDDTHTYGSTGFYEVALTVTDDDGGASISVYQYVVVYDPAAGFVTGAGMIDSPLGAYKPDPTLGGRTTFGFVSKYRKGINVPEGNTHFRFHAADLNFRSSSYEWLLVTGSNYAKFKGSGTINGGGEYKFMVWAGDDDPDTFRIKIWTEDLSGNETVYYDNGFDQEIAAGNVVIHNYGYARPTYGKLTYGGDPGRFAYAEGFRWLTSNATPGGVGHDLAEIYGLAGSNDTLQASPEHEYATLFGPGYSFYTRTKHYDHVKVYADSGDSDLAYIWDSSGDDHLAAISSVDQVFEAWDFSAVRAICVSPPSNNTRDVVDRGLLAFLLDEASW